MEGVEFGGLDLSRVRAVRSDGFDACRHLAGESFGMDAGEVGKFRGVQEIFMVLNV